MKAFISFLVGAVIVGVKATVDEPIITTHLPEGYTAVPFSMKGAIEPGGEVMTFNGTVTDIFEQIQSIKPDFEWDHFQPATPSSGRNSHIDCRVPGQIDGWRVMFINGYDYLKRINQPCGVSGGPRKCAMLWCFIGNSIWMCNDNTDEISRDCGDMASYVWDILGDMDCVGGTPGFNSRVIGQAWDTDGFNIIVGGGGCN
ncbi:hypothetical protein F4804DRAFT_333064 [Jackrogersella minutella]|nr:hypothetical protein F4804DRAFT_333064 [Jackrogersella minutella]